MKVIEAHPMIFVVVGVHLPSGQRAADTDSVTQIEQSREVCLFVRFVPFSQSHILTPALIAARSPVL